MPDEVARRGPPRQLRLGGVEYVALPPAPQKWDVDGREEYNRLWVDPDVGPLIQAGAGREHATVVRLAGALTAEQRRGRAGEVIAKAYRALSSAGAGDLHAAAARHAQLFEQVPHEVTLDDKLAFNRLLAKLDRRGEPHGFTPFAGVEEPPIFAVSEGSSLRLGPPRATSRQMPDKAHRVLFAGPEGSWLVARRWNRPKSGEKAPSLVRLGPSGDVVAQETLDHDVYVAGAVGGAARLAVMDYDGVFRIFDDRLAVVVERRLTDDLRYLEHFRTIIAHYPSEPKSCVYGVGVWPDGDRYLFTLADEAWCCSLDGTTLWGVVMPLMDGWQRVIVRRRRELPVYDDDDYDDDDDDDDGDEEEEDDRDGAQAGESTVGSDREAASDEVHVPAFDVPRYVEEPPKVGFEQTWSGGIYDPSGRLRVEVTRGRRGPKDRIQRASISQHDGAVLLGTESGKVIVLSKDGEPQVVFDVGVFIDEIFEVGRYSYLLTATRLYVIEDRRRLVAYLDIFRQGRLQVTSVGFALIDDRRLSWFSPSGTKLGEIHGREPIRMVREEEDGIVVQTSAHEARVYLD